MADQFKVFVGNLPYSFTEEMLKEAFIRIGGFAEEDITEAIVLKEKSQDPTRPPRSRGIGPSRPALPARHLAKCTLRRPLAEVASGNGSVCRWSDQGTRHPQLIATGSGDEAGG